MRTTMAQRAEFEEINARLRTEAELELGKGFEHFSPPKLIGTDGIELRRVLKMGVRNSLDRGICPKCGRNGTKTWVFDTWHYGSEHAPAAYHRSRGVEIMCPQCGPTMIESKTAGWVRGPPDFQSSLEG